MCSFLPTIQDKRVFLNEKDKIVWKLSKEGCSTVKSLYGVLEGRREDSFPILMILNPCVSSKVCFFAWEVWWEKNLTLDQLQKRSRHLTNRCTLCGEAEENIDHLLL